MQSALDVFVPLPASLGSRLSSSPRSRRVGKALLLAMVAFGVASALAPWRQTVSGSGQVVAYSPDNRAQNIEATISGRIARWHVVEGQVVEAGDLLVELTDNDAQLINRLGDQREAIEHRRSAQERRRATLEERLSSLATSQRAELRSRQAEVQAAREQIVSADEAIRSATAELEAARFQLTRIEELHGQGLSSRRELELARMEVRQAEANVASKEASRRAADSRLASSQAAVSQTRAKTTAEIESATATLRDAETDIAKTLSDLAEMDVTVSRQEAQAIRAPIGGMILAISKPAGNVQISRGEVLAKIVPETDDRSVELFIDGNDAAIIHEGDQVRLQFEGWPAVQFSGWPSVAVGTFGGKVAFVSPAGSEDGSFRVMIVADETEDPWPESRFLRQNVRAKGWLMLEEVSLGFELWRRFNGFPPALSRQGAPSK